MSFTPGYTSVLSNCATSGGSYTEIANLTDIKLPKITQKEANCTTLNQATNIEQTVPTMRENGKLTATVLYTEAAYMTLRGLVGTYPQFFKVATPDSHTYLWEGYIQEVGEASITVDKVIEFPLAITCLSDVTES